MVTESQNPSGFPYEIRVRGHLETYWAEFFEGWSLDNLENGEVLLAHPNIDQAGLLGVLNRILGLNLTLLSVNRTQK